MRENRKSIMLAVISGIVACIVCVGVVFMFPTNKNNLKNNENLNNNVNLNNNEREVKLGDTTCEGEYGPWTRLTDGNGSWTCSTAPSGSTGTPPDSATGSVWHGYEVGDDSDCGGGCSNPCHRTTTYTRTCYPSEIVEFNCTNKVYSGNNQTIATCPSGTLSGASQKNVGNYEVTCTVNGVAHTKTCSITKATPTINFNGATLRVGETQALGATSTPNCGTITYFTQGGSSIIIDDGHAVAVAVGSTTIRAVSQKNSNCEQATKDAVIEVIPAESTKTCYYLAANKCSAKTIEGTICFNANGYYNTLEECNSHVDCPAGYGADSSATTGCSYCAPGTYSPANDGLCHSCENNQFSAAGAESCTTISAPCCENPYGTPHQIEELTGCQQAVAGGATVIPGACPTTANVVVTSVSASFTGTAYLNSSSYNYEIDDDHSGGQFGYKTVTYVAYDQNHRVIDGSKLSWKYNLSGSGARVVAASQNSNGYVVTYRGAGCVVGTATATATASGINGATGSGTSPSMTIKTNKYTKWTRSNLNAENSNGWPLLANAEETESCNAVSDSYVEDGVTKYKYRYNRCGCGTGGTTTKYSFCCVSDNGTNANWLTDQSSKTCPTGYTIDNTKTETTCLKTYACYEDSNHTAHWTSMPEPSWVKVDKPEQECKDEEACFEDTEGNRFWGKHYDQIVNGYILITAIKDPATCVNKDEGMCYVNNNDVTDYRWSMVELDGYTKVEGVIDAKECQPEACYIQKEKNEFAFGKYKDNDDYIPVYKTVEIDGEYVDVLITNEKECTNEVPVGPTDFDVAKLVYVFMAILMACGIAFIYYSTVAKKQNQQ